MNVTELNESVIVVDDEAPALCYLFTSKQVDMILLTKQQG